ncbi:MAG: hypothetical protein Q9172_007492 [Xanthocarpia lactea]
MITKEEALEKVIATRQEAFEKVVAQLDGMVEETEKNILGLEVTSQDHGHLPEVLPGFPERIEGEIVCCNADDINTDGIYPGKYTYQDDVSTERMAERAGRHSHPCQEDPLVVAGSFGNIISRNSINNALMGVEVPKLVQRLRETFSGVKTEGSQQGVTEPSQNSQSLDSPPPASQAAPPQEMPLTRRTRCRPVWDVRRSKVDIQDENNGPRWSQKVGELPPNVQEIIATGGRGKWAKKQIVGFT